MRNFTTTSFPGIRKRSSGRRASNDSYVSFVCRLQYLLDESEMAKMIPTGNIISMRANSDAERIGATIVKREIDFQGSPTNGIKHKSKHT